jgi:Na+/glutamate symporter
LVVGFGTAAAIAPQLLKPERPDAIELALDRWCFSSGHG